MKHLSKGKKDVLMTWHVDFYPHCKHYTGISQSHIVRGIHNQFVADTEVSFLNSSSSSGALKNDNMQ
jgi:hypothetical protein